MSCNLLARCGRNPGHRGHHGGFVPVARTSLLTGREYEVVRRRALGHTWERLAADLGMARDTAFNHRRHAYEKYEASCFPDLLRAMGWLVVPGDPA
jgi:DNA-binding CsgD family transcriptional regulator